MPVVSVEQLVKYYGGKCILNGVSFSLEAGEKVGLVGRNGCGKTTLLALLAGRLEKDGGQIFFSRKAQVGYLTQELTFAPGKTVYEELRGLFAHLDRLQEELTGLEQAISQCRQEHSDSLGPLLERYAKLREDFEAQGGYRIDSEIQGVLQGLGLPKELWHQSPAKFSGGEKTRVALARLLLTRPNLLLLDEPTNYLDISAIQWLENYLRDYPGAILVVSHDRYFLDRVVRKILALGDGRIELYRGNYSYYREVWAERRRAQMDAYWQQQKELARKERFIREARATEKAKRQAKSLEKRLNRVERVERPPEEVGLRHLEFTAAGRTGKVVFRVEDLQKSYGNKVLFAGVNFKVHSGEHIVVMGPNGTGKTTLFRVLSGEEEPDAGQVIWGHGVQLGFFAQLLEAEELTGTVLDQVLAASDLTTAEARALLGAFLFQGDDVFLPVQELSGGEQRRLALAKLVLSNANVLFLDEPTNHLDLPSLDALEEALNSYEGTLLVITHDRFFAQRVGERIFVLEDGKLLEFADYTQYETWREARQQQIAEEYRSERKTEYQQQKRERRGRPSPETRRLQRELAECEAELTVLEEEKNRLLQELSRPEVFNDFATAQEYGRQLQEVEQHLEEAYNKWAALAEKVEAILAANVSENA